MPGPRRQRVAFDFYTLEGAVDLHKAMLEFKGGKLVLNIAEVRRMFNRFMEFKKDSEQFSKVVPRYKRVWA